MVPVPLASEVTEDLSNDLLPQVFVLGLVVRVAESFIARLKAELCVRLLKLMLTLLCVLTTSALVLALLEHFLARDDYLALRLLQLALSLLASKLPLCDQTQLKDLEHVCRLEPVNLDQVEGKGCLS